MTILVNGAGGAQADPLLAGLGVQLIAACTSFDATEVLDAFIDAAAGFPGTTSVKASLTPAASVLTAGSTGSYNDTTKEWTIGDTAGLSAGDGLYLSHGSFNDGVFRIASVVDGTNVTIEDADGVNPLDGAGNQSNVFYMVAWSWVGPTNAAPINHNGAGAENFWKFDADKSGINTQSQDSIWVADIPAGADGIAIDGGAPTGQTVNDTTLALAILRNWANDGGVTHVALANHSGQSVNNFTWTNGGGSGEVPIATALGGLTASAGDGTKYGRLVLRAKAGSAYTVEADISVTVDTSGPVITLSALAA